MAIGLILTVAVLAVQARLTSQNVRTSDTSLRDNEARAAMDAIARDLTGGGFLHAGSSGTCNAVLSYNSALPAAKYSAGFPVSALAGGASVVLPFVAGAGITLNYPTVASGNRSDVLVLRSTTDATQFSSTVTPQSATTDNLAYTPLATGVLPFSNSPTPAITAGNVGLLQVPVGTAPTQQIVCMRVPITSVGLSSGSTSVSSSGALMPSTNYTGFSGQLALTGLTGQVLSDFQLRSSKLLDLGTAAATNQRTYAYFVDADPARYRWPTLVRATINTLTDVEVAGSRQELAAGVASFQVLFGVGTPATGVTSYQTWPQVIAAGNAGNVLTVKVMVLSRSIYPDKEYVNPASSVPLQTQFSQTGYTDYTIPSGETANRFIAQESELVVRSSLWLK